VYGRRNKYVKILHNSGRWHAELEYNKNVFEKKADTTEVKYLRSG
jgi:hypothetical protein